MTTRARLPTRRECGATAFTHAGIAYIGKISRFEGGTIAEVFLSPSVKSGTALSHMAQALAVTARLCLQFGCPLEVLTQALPKLEDGSAADPLGGCLIALGKTVTPDAEVIVTCAQCSRAFDAKRPHARYCSTACRVAAHRVKACVTGAGQGADSSDPLVTHPKPASGLAAGPAPPFLPHPGNIPPVRYRRSLGDLDFRDSLARSNPGDRHVPDLPACLDRRKS